jgi:biopolymer transport protein ExbD
VLSAAGEVALDGSLLSPAELARALAGAALVELRADAAVPARILLPVLEALQQARVSQVDLVTRRAP